MIRSVHDASSLAAAAPLLLPRLVGRAGDPARRTAPTRGRAGRRRPAPAAEVVAVGHRPASDAGRSCAPRGGCPGPPLSTAGFSMVGVTWRGQRPDLALRTRADGGWTATGGTPTP